MAISSWKKTLFLVLAVCVVFSAAFTILLTARSFDHICCVNEVSACLPCLQIEAAKVFFRTLKLALAIMLFAVCLVFHLQSTKTRSENNNIYSYSPVSLKVRFNT